VNTICSQCGAVLSKGAATCIFCDASDTPIFSEGSSAAQGNLALNAAVNVEWRGELNQRLQAYRQRRRKSGDHEAQTQLPFAGRESEPPSHPIALQVDETAHHERSRPDDFAFTIAIGRMAKRDEHLDTQYLIDVSLPIEKQEMNPEEVQRAVLPAQASACMYPVATLDERRSAAAIDAACLAFAYGGFLALFGSLGGQFTLSKLSAAVYFFTFAFVYLQYFGLFTIFGGTTPGMMIRGLQVTTFSGEEPTLRHLLFRAAGYMLSAGTIFLGFLWALWDEDALTWHDRLSRTYLRTPEILSEIEASHPVSSR
jgi:uncharacterized RDD family membrane protein YckC